MCLLPHVSNSNIPNNNRFYQSKHTLFYFLHQTSYKIQQALSVRLGLLICPSTLSVQRRTSALDLLIHSIQSLSHTFIYLSGALHICPSDLPFTDSSRKQFNPLKVSSILIPSNVLCNKWNFKKLISLLMWTSNYPTNSLKSLSAFENSLALEISNPNHGYRSTIFRHFWIAWLT